MTAAEAREFLETAYRRVFQRAPDAGGLETYSRALRKGMSPAEVLRIFLASEEFRRSAQGRLDCYDAQTDSALVPYRTPEADALAAELASLHHVDHELYERLHQEACRRDHAPGLEYPEAQLQFHKRRFAELLNACCFLLKDKPHPRLLDIGNTQNLVWYKAVLPGVELVAADRPGGPSYAEPDHRICIDLNTGDLGPLSSRAPYDLVVCTEVIEHLSVNPVLLLRQLIGLLAENGALYLTTPNFFRFENLRKIEQRQNPQAVYPVDNSDYHHHTREYAMGELLRLVTEAGGRIHCWYFSDCWDQAPVREEERANLVIVAGK